MSILKRTAAAVALVALAALPAALPGPAGATPQVPGCDALEGYASTFAPPDYDLQHLGTFPAGLVDALNRTAWVDSITNNSAFLDSLPDGSGVVAEAIKDRPELDMDAYRDWVDTMVQEGDQICALEWRLLGTALGDTIFTTFGISRADTAVFEPILYFTPAEFMWDDGSKESTSRSGWVKNGFGVKAAEWTVTVAIVCNNCRIIDPGPYTTIDTESTFFWDCEGDFVEAKYFQPAPCCPDDKVECVKSVVKIAITSGGRSSILIKHKDWVEVKFEGWFGCKKSKNYTIHLCCDKVMTTKTTTMTGEPTRTFAMGEPVSVAGDNLPPLMALPISVFPNDIPLHVGMPIPPPMPGTAQWLFTNDFGQIQGTDLGEFEPVLMPAYMPWPDPLFDLGYDFIVDINMNGIWDPEEPALDVGEAGGFSSAEVSGVPRTVLPLELSSHPNPFNPTTTVSYGIGRPGQLDLVVYNLRGQRVRTLFSGQVAEPQGQVIWNGMDDAGRPVVSGVYFVHARAHNNVQVMKVAVIK